MKKPQTLITESTGHYTPKRIIEQLAAWILRDFEEIKDPYSKRRWFHF